MPLALEPSAGAEIVEWLRPIPISYELTSRTALSLFPSNPDWITIPRHYLSVEPISEHVYRTVVRFIANVKVDEIQIMQHP